MRRIVPVGLLLFLMVQQACQRDEATAPQRASFEPSARAADAGRSRIAFVRGGEIYVMAPDGSGPTQLTSDQAFHFDPSWSPDGRQIAFHRDRGARFNPELFGINTDEA